MNKVRRDYHYSLYSGNLGFFVRSVGHFQLSARNREPEKDASFGEIFWCVDGSGYFFHRGRSFILHPDQVWYYPPGSHQALAPGKNGFHYRWLTIEGPDAGMLFHGLGIRPGIQNACHCPEELFHKIEMNITATATARRLETLADAFRILTLAAGGRPKIQKNNSAEEIRDFINEEFSSPDCTVEALAERYHMHRVVLNRKFREAYNITVSEYIISKRIYEADRLLKESSWSLAEIAAKCGFASTGYFSKVMHKAFGQPPGHLRKLHQG